MFPQAAMGCPMARALHAVACLLATLAVAGAMPADAGPRIPQPDIMAYGPACAKSGDDAGWGGTHVSCYYACGKANFLSISVEASDSGAAAYGHTDCGGTAAPCNGRGQSFCVGVSETPTDSAQTKAKCSGSSDEWIDSPITLTCSAQGTNPDDAVCYVAKDLCNVSADDASASHALVADICHEQNPGVAEMVDALLAVVATSVPASASFVTYNEGVGAALAFAPEAGTCILQVLTSA